MQKVIEKVIEAKNFELSDILKKIDTLWVQGSLTEEQRKSLIDKARNNANMQNSINVFAKLEELDRKVLALEEEVKALKADGSLSGDEETEETIEEYVAGKYYYNGDKVSHEGSNYTCTAPEGVVCVWSPSEYPAYWQIEE